MGVLSSPMQMKEYKLSNHYKSIFTIVFLSLQSSATMNGRQLKGRWYNVQG
jgi:hypothetical protein